jgi:hypothetical protein
MLLLSFFVVSLSSQLGVNSFGGKNEQNQLKNIDLINP